MTTIRHPISRTAQPKPVDAVVPQKTATRLLPDGAPAADQFKKESGPASVPAPMARALSGAGNAVRTYFSNRTNVTTAAISTSAVGMKAVGLMLRGTPVAGNIINAASVLLSTAKACVRTAAMIKGDTNIEKSDLVADWGKVATDLGGVFFPPIGLAGAAASTAYTVYDAVDDRRKAKAVNA